MIKEHKKKQDKKDIFPNVETPPPPDQVDPSILPVQENSGQEKQQRPGKQNPEGDEKNGPK